MLIITKIQTNFADNFQNKLTTYAFNLFIIFQQKMKKKKEITFSRENT